MDKALIFLKSEYLTLKTVFEEVLIFSAQDSSVTGMKNYMLVALTHKREHFTKTKSEFLKSPIKLADLENHDFKANFAATNYLKSSR